jgi:hypothetical protein
VERRTQTVFHFVPFCSIWNLRHGDKKVGRGIGSNLAERRPILKQKRRRPSVEFVVGGGGGTLK